MNAIIGRTYAWVPEPVVPLEKVFRPKTNKLTIEEYEEIRQALKKPYHGLQKKLAEQYGVHPSLINKINKGKSGVTLHRK